VAPLVCLHGFTRTGRDFDELARSLAGRRRVICPDLVGRGRSSRLADPKGYVMRNYLKHVVQLLEALGVKKVALLGVSMGGLVAMGLAAHPAITVEDLVVVDVGPQVPAVALDLLSLYLSHEHVFPNVDALMAHVKRYCSACNLDQGPALRHFAHRGAKRLPDGRYTLSYDPAIRVPFADDHRNMNEMWPIYDSITARTLVIRGAKSHVLPAAVAAEMQQRGPRAALETLPGVGHWPSLMVANEIEIVNRFLDRIPGSVPAPATAPAQPLARSA
jgi:pimeloyl-ACP methyl ester carboxylesterase